MKTAVFGTKKHMLDNGISKEYKVTIKENWATHKLVPPGDHQNNIDEKSIQTSKNHFVGVLDGLPEYFPMNIWCRLLPKADMQLNIQRQYAIPPKI